MGEAWMAPYTISHFIYSTMISNFQHQHNQADVTPALVLAIEETKDRDEVVSVSLCP